MTSAPDGDGASEWSAPRGTILVVDDDAVNGRVLSRMVEMMGYRSFTVVNGEEAVKAIGVAEYDVVLMDCQMPVMDGFEATRIIRSQENNERRVPIVAVTAGQFPNEKQRCLDAGMDDFIPKPVMQGVLATTLDRVLALDPGDPVDVAERDIKGPPIDKTRLDELEATLGDEFVNVLASFCETTADRINALDVAINDGTTEEVHQVSSDIRGSARTFGCEGVAEAANLVDLALLSDDRTLWADAAWRMRTQLNDLKALLDQRFNEIGSKAQ